LLDDILDNHINLSDVRLIVETLYLFIVRFNEEKHPETIAEDQSMYEPKAFMADWYFGNLSHNILLKVYAVKFIVLVV
jgi:hypothetical protein